MFEQVVMHLDESDISADVVAEAEDSRLDSVVMGAVVENLTLEELADRCFVSVSTFKRHFRKRYSMPPHQWFIIRKLDLAYRMILATDVPVTEIARLCGFTNSSHFIAAFKRRYDTTPALLRRNHRIGSKGNTK
jgi:AraC-like DNA-binding protein